MQSEQLEQLRRDFLNTSRSAAGARPAKSWRPRWRAASADQIYLDVFQPTGYAVGRLWQENLFSVAQTPGRSHHRAGNGQSAWPLQPPAMTGEPGNRLRRRRTPLRRGAWRRISSNKTVGRSIIWALGRRRPTIAMSGDAGRRLIGLASQTVYRMPEIVEFMRHLETHGLDGLPVMVGGQAFVQPELVSSLGVHFPGRPRAVILANRLLLRSTRGQTQTDEAMMNDNPARWPSPQQWRITAERSRIIQMTVARSLKRTEVAQHGEDAEHFAHDWAGLHRGPS